MAVSPYVRTVNTASGARAVQIVHSSRRGSRQIEHIGSAHDDAELETLKAVARQRLATGQQELDLGLGDWPSPSGPLKIVSSRMNTCGRRCRAPTTRWDLLPRPGAMRRSGSWCSRG